MCDRNGTYAEEKPDVYKINSSPTYASSKKRKM